MFKYKQLKTDTATNKWRKLLLPVYQYELTKFLPLFLIKFFASFNYTILNVSKDTIVVALDGGGAEVIPVLKSCVVLVAALFVMIIYTKLSNIFSRLALFYIMIIPFLWFFLFFGFILFPNRESLSPDCILSILEGIIGANHKHWIFVCKYWMNSLFFVSVELWGGVIIGLLFWGFANHITSIKEAARFYALYAVGGHLGTTIGGVVIFLYSNILNGTSDFEHLTKALTLTAFIVGIIIIIIYWWANRYILLDKNDKKYISINGSKNTAYNKSSSNKLSLKDSIAYIIKSPYLILMAILVISYGLSVNFIEVSWKAALRLKYNNPIDYQEFTGLLQAFIGLFSFFIGLFFSGQALRRFGWKVSAMITPIIVGVTSLLFFILFCIFPNINNCTILTSHLTYFSILISFSPLVLFIAFGMIHNIICKSIKYCIFDPVKEIAYIPLDEESKSKGKAAVDLVGSRLGKSGSSFIQLFMIDCFGSGSILNVVVYFLPFFVLIIILWILSVHYLNIKFNNLKSRS